MIALKLLAKRALVWFGVACVVVFLFRSPDLAGALLDKVIDGVIGAVDAGARLLERVAK
jgi:hypothetical protein